MTPAPAPEPVLFARRLAVALARRVRAAIPWHPDGRAREHEA